MLRFFMMLMLLLFIGTGVLSLVDPSSVGTLFFFVFGILSVAVVLKIALDFILFHKKMEEDDKVDGLLKESKGKTFDNFGDYTKALRKKYKRR